MHAPEARLAQVIDRFDQVEARLGAAGDADEIVKLSKEHAELKPVAEKANALKSARAELAELAEMMEGDDAEMAEMAREEFYALKERLPELEHAMSLMLLPKDKDDSANAMIEIRAGTGGDEAAIFAGNLYGMYQRYAQLQGWSWELVSASDGEHGGYKEVVAAISGNGVFGRLKFESGVHRVQRPKARAASIPLLPRSPSCRSRKISISNSTWAMSGSTRCAPLAPAASTSTRPTVPCA
jgi:peptide chain release factor 1